MNSRLNRWAIVATAGWLFCGAVAQASDTDDRIIATAKKSYVFKTYLKDDSIHFKSRNGVVVLTGTVANPSHRSLAEDTVNGLPGVVQVDDQLRVKAGGPAEHSDGWISFKVKSALVFHRNVRAGKTEVNVVDGVVTLTGEANSAAQKELTTEYARDVEGVKEVKNLMTVVNPAHPPETLGEKVDDASITAVVKSTLMAHRSTSALRTKVHTVEGVVTLTGTAKNAAEKDLVTKLVSDVNGVLRVDNRMTINPDVSSR